MSFYYHSKRIPNLTLPAAVITLDEKDRILSEYQEKSEKNKYSHIFCRCIEKFDIEDNKSKKNKNCCIL